jgi:small subunit ribosomal protein S11
MNFCRRFASSAAATAEQSIKQREIKLLIPTAAGRHPITDLTTPDAAFHFRTQQVNATQTAMQATLSSLISHNQQTREWVRNHRSANGSISAAEHHEQIPAGVYQIHVNASRNNTFVTLTDWQHRVLKTASGGRCGLNGYTRGTSEAGTRTASRMANAAVELGAREIYVTLKGFGSGRETAFRSLVASGLNIRRITDKTPIPHGGCKPKKARRV